MRAAPQGLGRKAEQSQATQALLVRVARAVFAERGYAEAGTDLIAQRAGVSRGALYHQFGDKQALFRAVYDDVQRELLGVIMDAIAASGSDIWDIRLRAGFAAYLDYFMEPGRRRIVLQDAPGVLDWATRNEIHMQHGLGALIGALSAAMEAGALGPQPAAELGHVIHGALNEGAMTIARSDGDAATRLRIGAAIDRLLDGLAPPVAKPRD